MIFSPLTGFHSKGPIKPHHQRHPLTLKQNWKPTGQSVSSSSFKVAGITFAEGHGLLLTRLRKQGLTIILKETSGRDSGSLQTYLLVL
jgi:hypothetical protein